MSWQSVSLGEVLPLKYGKGLPARDRSESGEYSVVSSAGRVGSHSAALTTGPSVVVGRKGTIGAAYFYSEPVWPIDTTFYVEPSDVVDIRFAYYLLSDLPLTRMNSDSAVPGLNRSDAERLRILLPPLEEQRAIAATLGALDDKIESNRRQLSLLERMGRNLYEAAVSKGSVSVTVGDMVQHRPGKHLPRAKYRPGPVPIYGSNSVMGEHDTPLYDGPFAVMARIGSSCGALRWTEDPAWVNNNASALLPGEGKPAWVLRHALGAIDMSRFRVGTGQPFIAVKALMASTLLMPPVPDWEGLDKDLRRISVLESQRQKETRALRALRDSLLPELLSGRLKVDGRDG